MANRADLIQSLTALSTDDRVAVGKSLLGGMEDADRSSFYHNLLEDLTPEHQKRLVVQGIGQLPSGEKKAVVSEAAAQLTPQEKAEVVRGLGALPLPGGATRDRLWLITISAFALVFVFSFVAIAAGLFLPLPKDAMTKPELVLAMFTSVVGFLSGLFVPSPSGKP